MCEKGDLEACVGQSRAGQADGRIIGTSAAIYPRFWGKVGLGSACSVPGTSAPTVDEGPGECIELMCCTRLLPSYLCLVLTCVWSYPVLLSLRSVP